jgi:hypothetical protein
MRRGDAGANVPKTDLLKIDKDCLVHATLQREYIQTVIDICRERGIKVLWIKRTDTAHGLHYYIGINPPVDALTANNLQCLLGDDSKRVGYNKARIYSGLVEWNKLFERVNCGMTTLYRVA